MRKPVFRAAGVAAAMTLSGAALGQAAPTPLVNRADSMMQMSAASLMPTLRGRWLYADEGLVVGRVREVRVSADGNTLVAVVLRRRWLGGGEVGVPVPRLRQVGNDLSMSGTRAAIRAMPPL
ncbi:PRC-barrel domain containing protein [Methylobacterium segetis]|uniref:PRC-barrel domain containing protein n=1 Tax=Methylobacterium segetis TaxID=2488750 RepID=UPI001FDFD8BC|nr:PRC-barrel domain containing protein [Methylobacterium segetis]